MKSKLERRIDALEERMTALAEEVAEQKGMVTGLMAQVEKNKHGLLTLGPVLGELRRR